MAVSITAGGKKTGSRKLIIRVGLGRCADSVSLIIGALQVVFVVLLKLEE